MADITNQPQVSFQLGPQKSSVYSPLGSHHQWLGAGPEAGILHVHHLFIHTAGSWVDRTGNIIIISVRKLIPNKICHLFHIKEDKGI